MYMGLLMYFKGTLLSLPNHEKEAMIKRYYNDINIRTSGKKFIFVSCLVLHDGKHVCPKRLFEK